MALDPELSFGGKINTTETVIANTFGKSAMLTVDGTAVGTAKLTNSDALFVGDGGAAFMRILHGGEVSDKNGIVGDSATVPIFGTGSVVVTGAGSKWTNTGNLTVAALAVADITITDNGEVSDVDAVVGFDPGAAGSVSVADAAKWTSTGDVVLGNSGKGTMLLQHTGTATVADTATLGKNLTGEGIVTIDGTASKWTVGFLHVGDNGNGTLRLQNDGDLESLVAIVGVDTGGVGLATVTGVGSKWTNTDAMIVGNFGKGTLNIEATGEVVTKSLSMGGLTYGEGHMTVTGMNSRLTVADQLTVADFNFSKGNLQVENAGKVASAAGVIGHEMDSIGEAIITGAGSLWAASGDFQVGDAGSGTLKILSGGVVTSGINATLGSRETGVGVATVDGAGSLWAVTDFLVVGSKGEGSVVTRNGGKVTAGKAIIGNVSTAQAAFAVDGAGSTVTTTGTFTVGEAGHGELAITAGGVVSSQGGTIGNAAGGKGVATVSGAASKWDTGASPLTIGNFGAGELAIVKGATVANATGFLGRNPGSSGTVMVQDAGSTWNVPGALFVGGDAAGPKGAGLVRLEQGGRLNSGAATILRGGALEIGAAFVLNAAALTFNDGTLRTLADTTFSTNATLAAGGVTVDSMGATSTISGIFSGTGGFKKVNTGRIVVASDHTATGDTQIDGGDLIVNGSIASANTFINRAGLLGGSGLVKGNAFNHGIVSPGNSPGTLHIGGNYTQFSDGTLRLEIVSREVFDRLVIGGSASLAGTLAVVANGVRFKRGDTFDFLTAAGGISGNFDRITGFGDGTILGLEVVIDGGVARLVAVSQSFRETLLGLTPNQRAVAGALDEAGRNQRAGQLLDFLSTEPLGKLPADFDKIAPEELASIFNLAVSLANVQTANLERRMDDLRAGASGFSASGFAMSGSAGSYSGGLGLAGPAGKGGKMMVPAAENRWGVFVTGVGEFTKIGDTYNARGYDMTTGGFTFGVDYRLTPNFALGVNAGYARTGIDLNHGGRIAVDGGKLGLYATYFTGGFYADAAVSGGLNGYSTRRSALQGAARGSENGGEMNALFATGYDWKVGALTLGPTASFQYTYASLGSFTETGSLAPLHYGSQHGESLRSAVGAKASYDWKIGGVLIRPEVRAAWQHEYGQDGFAITSSFANGGGGAFTTHGPQTGRDSLLLGAGFAVQWSERTSTYVYYDGEIARSNYGSNNVSAGVRIAF